MRALATTATRRPSARQSRAAFSTRAKTGTPPERAPAKLAPRNGSLDGAYEACKPGQTKSSATHTAPLRKLPHGASHLT